MLTILLVILILLAIGAWPRWPYAANWRTGYWPSGGLGLVILILLIAAVLGRF